MPRLTCFLIALSFLGSSVLNARGAGVSAVETAPVLFVTPAMLDTARQRVEEKKDPWHSAWLKTLESAKSALDEPFTPYTGKETIPFRLEGFGAFMPTRDMALVYAISGEEVYAEKARTVLLDWATTQPSPGVVCETQRPQYPNSNIGLDLAIPMVSYCYAYSLLYDGFALSERADIERWVRDMAGKIRFGHEAWIQANYFGGQDFNNHLSAHVMALAIIGYTLRDQAMIDYAIDSPDNPRDWGEMVDGAILMPTQPQATHGPGAQWDQKEIEAGEIYDRTRISQGKGLGYSLVNLKDLTFTAEVARNNGLDLYSHTGPYGENLKVSYDYFSNYVIAKDPSALAGGYYTEETTAPGEAVALYEMVYRVWPDDPKIEAVLRSCDRVVDQHAFLGWTVVLTHGMPVE